MEIVDKRPEKALATLGISIAAVFGIFILVAAYWNLISIGFILLYGMLATIVIILMVPLFFSFEHWMSSDKDVTKPTDVVQIDATVIIGILIFLTINATTTNTTTNEVPVQPLFNPKKTILLPERALIAALNTLTIIPFALSSMIILIWGNESVCKRKNTSAAPIQTSFSPENEIKMRCLFIFPSNEMIANQLASHRVTGLKLGVTFVDNFIDDNICNGNFQELLTIGLTSYGEISITLSGRRSKASFHTFEFIVRFC